MINFFHRLFNPHCIHCQDELRESKVCESCDTLRSQITRLQYENERLLNNILQKPVEPSPVQFDNSEKIKVPKTIPWNVRRQMLETEDRERAKLMKRSTEELEKEIGVGKDVS